MNKLIEELAPVPHWVCWQGEPVRNKRTGEIKISKRPVYGTQGSAGGYSFSYAKTNNPATWGSYETARRWVDSLRARYKGMGFVLSFDTPYICIDLDHCLDSSNRKFKDNEAGRTAARVMEIITRYGETYAEVSPSGDGVHIWGRGNLPQGKEKGLKNENIEIYRAGRFMTVTGEPFHDTPVSMIQQAVDEIIKEFHLMDKAPAPAPAPVLGPAAGAVPLLEDGELIQKIRNSRQGEKFHKLYDLGDMSGYGDDHSSADQALMDLLAYWTKDREQLKRLFLLSALGQNIGRKKHHEGDYLNRTINKALSIVTVGYNPKAYAAQKRAEELDREKRNPPVSGGTAKPEPVETGVPFLEMVRRFNGNDSENADRLAAYCAGKFLYCVDLKTWLMFDGKKWKPVALTELIKPARAAITHTLAILARGYATFTGGGGVLADETMKRYNDMLRYLTKTANNEKNLFSSIRLAAGDDSMKCYATDFDRDPYLLNCDNGVLNLKTGELIPHNPEQRFMKCARAAYDRKAHSTLWADTVRQIVPDADTRDYMQRLAGYCMSGDVGAEKIFFLHGTGGNGKGVFIETLGHALGDYATSIPVEILLSNKYGRDGNNATPEKAKLKGVRLAKSSESSIDSYFDDGALKLLTGGDEITARPLHSNPITFSPSHKLVVSTNHMPAIKDVSDEGIKRRLVIIPFHAHFAEPDRHLKSKLMEPDNMADCLLWAYEGFKRYQEKGVDDNTFSQEIRDSNRTYYMNNDFIGEFFDGSCNVGPMYSVSTQRLYKSYQSFADDSGSPKLKRRQFTELIKKRLNVTPVKSHGGRYLKGVGLKDVADY